MSTPLPVVVDDRDETATSRALARRLGLRLQSEAAAPYVLRRGARGLELGWSAPQAPGPVRADFAAWLGRVRGGSWRGQPLLRAVGECRLVVDACAGLGRDAFVLAAAGRQVVACEREPVLAELLADGLARARDDDRLRPIAARIRLVVEDARTYLGALSAVDRPDVVYLDPMFPAGGGSAQVKKEMQLFRGLLAGRHDDDADRELLALACRTARARVVVKRHRHEPPLAGSPSGAIRGATVRFDLYAASSGG
jgi:16S rRNA (guanine1516-N2)-methyltransferase